jgi:aspartate kinase
MKVMKFGGTSVGTPQRMKNVAQLINDGEQNLVVLSAMSGTTNSLLEIADYLYKQNLEGAHLCINKLQEKYTIHVDELYQTEENKKQMHEHLGKIFDTARTLCKLDFTQHDEKQIVAMGEVLSTNMMTKYLDELGVKVCLLSALDFMKKNVDGEPDMKYIKEHLRTCLSQNAGYDVYITQGFICLNADDEIDNLQRGGSDYTASLVGAAIGASEIQIWTDIDGMHNNDPRYVEGTKPVSHLHFVEAAELAYFGAKILHPTCIQPAQYANIPVKLLNTMDPTAPGTTISNITEHRKIKAVAAKDNIVAINITSTRMLLAYGFLRRVFEVFEKYKTSIDMICTSEVGVSMSIDDTTNLIPILDELKKFGVVEVDDQMCIICVVGDLDWRNVGFEALAARALENIPVRMISYGGSNHNISFLVSAADKQRALQALSKCLF